MPQATTTVQIDEKGRVVIPKPAREKLGIDGRETLVELTVEVDG